MYSFNIRKNISFTEYISSHLKSYFNPIQRIFNYPKNFRNYMHIIKKRINNEIPTKVILKNGTELKIKNIDQFRLSKSMNKCKCNFNNDVLEIKKKGLAPVKLSNWVRGDVYTVFFNDDYKNLPVNGKIVIDIGANIGDTAILFSLRGAEKVIALEPVPMHYESAKKNIELNGLSEKIELKMAGCSNKKGSIQISKQASGADYSLKHDSSSHIKVSLLTLNDILQTIESKSCILKLDCEGCEYDIILDESCENLRRFSHMQIEYHFGYKNLKKKLEKCGFKISVTPPSVFTIQGNIQCYVGYIFAVRKN